MTAALRLRHQRNPVVSGWVADRFALVRDALTTNLRTGDDLGAAVCVFLDGQPVVDIHGGLLADGSPYPEDALHVVHSVSKAVLAVEVALLIQEGVLDLDASVATYWPEFGREGKEPITLRMLLGHQAGLAALPADTGVDELCDWTYCTTLLAAQAPSWVPGTRHGYHAITIGYLAGEVVRRVTGRTPGTLLRDRLAEPLDLDCWIGTPPDKHARVARYVAGSGDPDIGAVMVAAMEDPTTETSQAFPTAVRKPTNIDDPRLWAAEVPALACIGDARSLARLLAAAATGPTPLVGERVLAGMTEPVSSGPDAILVDQPTRFGCLFMLGGPREPMLSRASFGHNGMAGTLAFVDPPSGVAFAYVGNRSDPDPTPHRRITRLVAAVRDCL